MDLKVLITVFQKMIWLKSEAVIKVFNYYSLITSEAKYKSVHGRGIRSMSARVTHDSVSDH